MSEGGIPKSISTRASPDPGPMVPPLLAHKEEDGDRPHWPTPTDDDDDYPEATTEYENEEETEMPSPGEYWSSGRPPWLPSTITQWPPETLSTSVIGDQSSPTPFPENGASTTPTPINSNGTPSPSASNDAESFKKDPAGWKNKESNHTAVYAAAGIVPVVLIIIGAVAFFYIRKRRRQAKNIATTQERVREMKMRNQPSVRPFMAPAPIEPQYTAPPNDPPPPASPTTPQPVILGPISSGSNGAYFTGIDTSDSVSVNSRTGLGDPFADGNSLQEEPPPPYRPTSLPPLSRDTSLRVPNAATSSQTHLIDANGQPIRSPFADPEDDDVVSEISGPTTRRNPDAMSDVSDMSYQADPIVTRPSV